MGQAPKAQRIDQQQASDRSQLLLEVNNVIVSHLDLPELLKAISACLRRAIPHDAAGLALYDSGCHLLRAQALDFPGDQRLVKLAEAGVLIPLEGTPKDGH